MHASFSRSAALKLPVVLLALTSAGALADSGLFVDQQQPVIDSAGGILPVGGSANRRLAQLVTAGVSRFLAEVRLAVSCSSGDLRVEIQGASGSTPNGQVLASEVVSGEALPDPWSTPRFSSVFFSPPIPFDAGDRFAVVLGSSGDCGSFAGPPGDSYPGGQGYSQAGVAEPGAWSPLGYRADLPFQTVVGGDDSFDDEGLRVAVSCFIQTLRAR